MFRDAGCRTRRTGAGVGVHANVAGGESGAVLSAKGDRRREGRSAGKEPAAASVLS